MTTLVTTSTATVTINAAFLQEIKEVNQEVWQLLDTVRDLCSDPTRISEDPHRFVDLTADLRDQLALHFALEEAYGYFDEPLYVAPRLAEQAESLRAQHRDLYRQFSDFAEHVEGLNSHARLPAVTKEVAHRFQAIDRHLREHEAREEELILQAFDDDIGVGD